MDEFEARFDSYCTSRGFQLKVSSVAPRKTYERDGYEITMVLNKARNTLDLSTESVNFHYQWLNGAWRLDGGNNRDVSSDQVLATLAL